jgi:hypothetical protein
MSIKSYFHSGLHLTTPVNGSQGTTRGGMFARSRTRKAQRMLGRTLAMLCTRDCAPPITPPKTVTLIRVAPRELDDDNLRPAFKSIRDGIADFFGVADSKKQCPWAWEYMQEKRPESHTYGVEVRMEW